MPALKKILIANRGEIAVRIIRTAKEMGIRTVAVHSLCDANSLHVRMADESVCIGKDIAKHSYLNMVSLLSAVELSGADSVHPGYGFLSERAEFAEIVTKCGVKFIGPSSASMRVMGSKVEARGAVAKAGVPLLPGTGVLADVADARVAAAKIGYPVLIKASNGGGGRGMRVVRNETELEQTFFSARSESQTAFGSPDIFIEKFIEKPRHIEIQILADQYGNTIHLGERECTLQRRHQKIIEEALSPVLSAELREQMGKAACEAARAANYEGLGTVEFIMDENSKFYFMEMNTRVQVEHPVTEEVTGLDLIREQIEVAEGKKLTLKQEDIKFSGHAIECRVNAEDPTTFVPCPGLVTTYIAPGGRRVRVDSAVYQGYKVPPFYDSMIAKVITWGNTREEARIRMVRALQEFVIEGIKTNIQLHLRILQHPSFATADFYTNGSKKCCSRVTSQLGEEDLNSTIEKLMADLEIDLSQESASNADLEADFGTMLSLQSGMFAKVGLDAAAFIGFAGDWKLSLDFANRLLELNDDRLVVKLWQLRCLVELRRFAEAAAVSSSLRWPVELLIHVNYLTGFSLEALGLREQAQTRYRAVYDANSSYRDVAQRVLNR